MRREIEIPVSPFCGFIRAADKGRRLKSIELSKDERISTASVELRL